MDVTLPDGTVIKDVPDGMSKAQLAQKLQANGYDISKLRPEPAPQLPFKIGQEGFADAMKEVASRGFGRAEQFLGGAGAAFDLAALRAKQFLGGLTPEEEMRVQQQRALAGSTGATAGGNIAGNIAMTAAPGIGLQGAATNLAARVLPGALAVPAGAAVTGATIAGTTNPVLKGESEAKNMALGAAGNVLGTYAAKGLSRLAQPIQDVSKATYEMVKRGLSVTPGQATGGNSILGKIEQQLQSAGVFGLMVEKARGAGVKDMNVAAIRQAVPAGTEKEIVKSGREAVERAGDLIDTAYDKAYAGITTPVSADAQFYKSLTSIPKKEGIDLSPSFAERFDNLIKDRVLSRLQDASADTVRNVQNSLGALARKFRASNSADERSFGMAFQVAKTELRDLVSRQGTPEFRSSLEALDGKYRDLLAIEKASGYAGSKEGVFSADALARATKTATPALKEFANNARSVYGSTVPDSGTAGRLSLQYLPYLLGAGGVANHEWGGPEYLTALGLASLLATPMAGRYALGGYPGQQAIADALRQAAPFAGQIGRSVLFKK